MAPSPVKPSPYIQLSGPRKSSQDKNVIVHEQPEPSIPMTPMNAQSSGGGDRNALGVPVEDDGLRKWSYGIRDCFADRRTCCLSCCCCCYVYSRNKRRFDHLETHGTPLREPVERCNRDCKWYCLLGPAVVALQAISRSNIRRRYGIRGNPVRDVVMGGYCTPCALVQEHREIQLEESSFD